MRAPSSPVFSHAQIAYPIGGRGAHELNSTSTTLHQLTKLWAVELPSYSIHCGNRWPLYHPPPDRWAYQRQWATHIVSGRHVFARLHPGGCLLVPLHTGELAADWLHGISPQPITYVVLRIPTVPPRGFTPFVDVSRDLYRARAGPLEKKYPMWRCLPRMLLCCNVTLFFPSGRLPSLVVIRVAIETISSRSSTGRDGSTA